jgi:hypothetical protein
MHQYPTYFPIDEKSDGPGIQIDWQKGPIGERFNGATPEGVIRCVIDRLTYFQSQLPCAENIKALACLHEAMGHLDTRTRERFLRGVMGTNEP